MVHFFNILILFFICHCEARSDVAISFKFSTAFLFCHCEAHASATWQSQPFLLTRYSVNQCFALGDSHVTPTVFLRMTLHNPAHSPMSLRGAQWRGNLIKTKKRDERIVHLLFISYFYKTVTKSLSIVNRINWFLPWNLGCRNQTCKECRAPTYSQN